MPRKAQTTTITKVIDDQSEAAPLEAVPSSLDGFEMQDPQEDEIQSFLTQFGTACYLTIHRVERTGERAYLAKCEPKFWSEEWLQDTYGEGRYIIQIKNEKHQIRGTRTITIGPAPKKFADPLPNYQPPPVVQPAPVEGADLKTQMLMEEMRANRELMLEMVRGMRPGGDAHSLAEVVSLAKSLIPPPQEKSGGWDTLMEVLKTGIEIGTTGTVDTTKDKGFMGILKDALPMVGDVLKTIVPSRAAAPDNPPAQAPPALPAFEGVDPAALQMLRHGIAYLKSKVLQGKAVELYADFILDSLEDPQWQPFMRFAMTPYEEFAKIDPELLQTPYRPWFEKLLSSVKEAIEEANGSNENKPTDGESGDDRNTADNG